MTFTKTPDTAAIHVEKDAGVAIVTIHNPERMNAIAPEMATDLVRSLQEFRTDDSVRAIVLTGAGNKAFCSGAQLRSERGKTTRTQLKTPLSNFGEIARWLVAVDKPVIAAISGFAV